MGVCTALTPATQRNADALAMRFTNAELVDATLVTPVVLAYSAFAYWVFRGRTPEKGWEQ